MCFRLIYFSDSPSDQGETCTVLHFAVYLEDYTCSVHFPVQLEPTEVTQEGVNTGAFLFFIYSFVPHLPPTVHAYIFIARRVRRSLSLVDHEVEVCLLTKLFSIPSLSTTRYESEKKNALAEIRTRYLGAKTLREHQLDHRGDRLATIRRHLTFKRRSTPPDTKAA